MITAEMLLNAEPQQSALVDNATATVTRAATGAQRHFLGGIRADYSAAVAAIKTITIKFGTVAKFVYRWDFSKGPFIENLPLAIKTAYNEALSVELEASGTGGVTGRVGMYVATI